MNSLYDSGFTYTMNIYKSSSILEKFNQTEVVYNTLTHETLSKYQRMLKSKLCQVYIHIMYSHASRYRLLRTLDISQHASPQITDMYSIHSEKYQLVVCHCGTTLYAVYCIFRICVLGRHGYAINMNY